MIDVEKMAREAGGVCMIPAREDINPAEWVMTTSDLERFAQAVARRCAEIAQTHSAASTYKMRDELAAAIRAEFGIEGE